MTRKSKGPVILLANRTGTGAAAAGVVSAAKLLPPSECEAYFLDEHEDRLRGFDRINELALARGTDPLHPDDLVRVVVVGGDGSVSWVLKAMHDRGIGGSVAVAPAATGTGNDMAGTLRWPRRFQPTWLTPGGVQTLVARARACQPALIDVWRVQATPGPGGSVTRMRRSREEPVPENEIDHLCLNYWSAGLDAELVRFVERFRMSNRDWNRYAYMAAGLVTLCQMSRPVSAMVESCRFDGQEVAPPDLGQCHAVIGMSIRSYGGGVGLWRMAKASPRTHAPEAPAGEEPARGDGDEGEGQEEEGALRARSVGRRSRARSVGRRRQAAKQPADAADAEAGAGDVAARLQWPSRRGRLPVALPGGKPSGMEVLSAETLAQLGTAVTYRVPMLGGLNRLASCQAVEWTFATGPAEGFAMQVDGEGFFVRRPRSLRVTKARQAIVLVSP